MANPKQAQSTLSDGPVKDRHCTDILFFLLFIAHIVVFVSVASTGFQQGEPDRLLSGMDYEGKLCGLTNQKTDGGLSLSNATNLYYSMNVTSSLEASVGGMFSDTNTTTFDPNSVSASSASILEPSAFFTSWGNTLIFELGTYFIPVCQVSCDFNVTANSTDTRTYVWTGPSDPSMTANWNAYVTAAESDPSLMVPFTFTALPVSICPYDPEYCVPLQFATFTSVLDRYCVPQLTDVSSTFLVPSSFSSTIESGFGESVGDIITSWPVIVIMAFGGLAIGIVFLYILRLCVGVFIWLSIFLCFLLLLGGAVTCLLYSQKCAGESLFSTASAVNSTSAVTSLLQGSSACQLGYSIQSASGRDSFRYTSYVLFGISGLYLIVILFISRRIRLGIAVNKVAAQFVRQNMSSIFVPIVQTLVSMIWWAIWLVCIVYTITVIPDGYRDMTSTWTNNMTAASDGCNGQSGVYTRSYVNVTDPTTNTTSIEPVYACKETKYVIQWSFWYSLFSLLWVNGFILSCGQTIIAGAVGVWYFAANKKSLSSFPVLVGFRNTFVYHLGTMAFGSLLLAGVNLMRIVFFWVAKVQKKNPTNKVLALLAWIVYGILTFVEKIMRFINKNAYIQTALLGTNFCVSCKNAVSLIMRNALRIGTLAVIGKVVHFLGVSFITVGTAIAGWGMLASWYDGKLYSPLAPLIVIMIIGYCIGSIIISVFSIAVDSVLQCFIADEEMHKNDGGAKYTPSLLQKFLPGNSAVSPPTKGQPVNVVGI